MKRFITMMMAIALCTLGSQAQQQRFETSRLINAGYVTIEKGSRKYNFFLCGGNPETEKWYTEKRVKLERQRNMLSDKYNKQYKKLAEKTKAKGEDEFDKKLSKQYDRYRERYYKKRDKLIERIYEGDSMYERYTLLYFVDPSFDPPYALAYRKWIKDESEDMTNESWNCELIAMKSNIIFHYDHTTKPEMTSIHMKVDDVLLDSIRTLTRLVHYTALNMGESILVLDGTRVFIFNNFRQMRFTQDSDDHARLLARTFGQLYKCVEEHDEEGLEALRPTINDLIAYYRTLILPDQYLHERNR